MRGEEVSCPCFSFTVFAIPGPQRRGTGGTLDLAWIAPRHRGRPPNRQRRSLTSQLQHAVDLRSQVLKLLYQIERTCFKGIQFSRNPSLHKS